MNLKDGNMTKLFISQPMKNRNEQEILKEREELIAEASKYHKDIKVIESYFSDFKIENGKNIAVTYLGESIKNLAMADVAIFAKEWQNARECIIEHDVCNAYGIQIMISMSK